MVIFVENIYVFEQNLDEEFIRNEYINFINKSKMYRTDIDTSLLLIEKKYFELNSRILKMKNVEKSEKNRLICLFDILKARNAISEVT